MLIAKILFLQVFWYIVVYFSTKLEVTFLSIALIFSILNYFIYVSHISVKKYFLAVFLFTLFGIYEINSASYLGLIDYKSATFPMWLLALYTIFICYYGDAFNYLSKLPIVVLSLMGALGGCFAFYGGVKISSIEVLDNLYFVLIGINWAIFFPLSIHLFYKNTSNKI